MKEIKEETILMFNFAFLGDRLGFPHPSMDLPTSNGTGACNGVSPFAHANGGLSTSTCPSGNSMSNGLGLHNNHNNNNSSTHNNNNTSSHPLLHNGNSSSDRCSSSGVSSFDSSESRPQRPLLIPPPSLVSDDSNHSTHSHASSHQPMQLDTKPTTNYKFKNSIKQRFSADQRIKTSTSPPPSASSSEASPKYQATMSNQGVPIFALHDNGGFYIPLTVEASMLRPHMGYTADIGSETLLHPVTISVNFNHSMPPAWSHQSPTHQI